MWHLSTSVGVYVALLSSGWGVCQLLCGAVSSSWGLIVGTIRGSYGPSAWLGGMRHLHGAV